MLIFLSFDISNFLYSKAILLLMIIKSKHAEQIIQSLSDITGDIFIDVYF
jgi:hypothetical protein